MKQRFKLNYKINNKYQVRYFSSFEKCFEFIRKHALNITSIEASDELNRLEINNEYSK